MAKDQKPAETDWLDGKPEAPAKAPAAAGGKVKVLSLREGNVVLASGEVLKRNGFATMSKAEADNLISQMPELRIVG